MAGELNTAEKQNEIRREQKRKQRVGKKKGFSRHVSAGEKIKLPRVVSAKFSGETRAAIDQHIASRPDLPLTTGFFKKILKRGDPIDFKVTDENFPTMQEGEFQVTSERIDTPIFVHTVRFWTGLGYGIEIKKLPSGKVIVD